MELDIQGKDRLMKTRAIKRLVGACILFVFVVFGLPMILSQPILTDSDIPINEVGTARVFADQTEQPAQSSAVTNTVDTTSNADPVNLSLATNETPKQSDTTMHTNSQTKDTHKSQQTKKQSASRKSSDEISRLIDKQHTKVNYVLQLAAYARKKDAELRKRDLISKGVENAYVERIKGTSGRSLYRLRVGPFPSLSDAKAMKVKLVSRYKGLEIRKN